jgi:UDP-glucose 4-epimerase
MKNILLLEEPGYIGSRCVISLINNGYNPIIVDSLSNSYKNVIKIFKKN